jgi:predicted RNA-binding protein with PUA-like domain
MARRTKKYWLMKSEPSCYSINDLAAEPDQQTHWDGVRNYQARNLMRDEMKVGDAVLFYNSNAKPPAVAGTATVCREAYPDFTALDKHDKHFDPKATNEDPIWQMVDIELDKVFDEPVGLPELREVESLSKMMLLQRGSRLSVQPVAKSEFDTIVKLARKKATSK